MKYLGRYNVTVPLDHRPAKFLDLSPIKHIRDDENRIRNDLYLPRNPQEMCAALKKLVGRACSFQTAASFVFDATQMHCCIGTLTV